MTLWGIDQIKNHSNNLIITILFLKFNYYYLNLVFVFIRYINIFLNIDDIRADT